MNTDFATSLSGVEGLVREAAQLSQQMRQLADLVANAATEAKEAADQLATARFDVPAEMPLPSGPRPVSAEDAVLALKICAVNPYAHLDPEGSTALGLILEVKRLVVRLTMVIEMTEQRALADWANARGVEPDQQRLSVLYAELRSHWRQSRLAVLASEVAAAEIRYALSIAQLMNLGGKSKAAEALRWLNGGVQKHFHQAD